MNIVTVKKPYEKETNEVKGKVIRKAQIARQLLHRGAKMIDLKPDRDDPDRKRSVYIFEQSDEFENIFSSILDENRRNRQTTEENAMKKEIEDLRKQLEELQRSTITTDIPIVKEVYDA